MTTSSTNSESQLKIFVSKYTLLLIIFFFLILDIFQFFFSFPLQIIIIVSNIEIIILLFISYKYLTKGFLTSLVVNIFNSVELYINYQKNNDLILFHMATYRIVSIVLSGLIYFLSTKQQKYINQIKTNSYIDNITNIFNHRYFLERIETEFSRAKRTSSILGIIMIDIDNFRKFNDTYGHKEGDVVLHQSAYIIQNTIRPNDVVCRYGGDEFVVILQQLKKDEINLIANSIRENYEIYVNNTEKVKSLSVSISLGYSSYPCIASTKDELISQADTALYHAKQQGRNNIKIYKDVFNDIKQILDSTESQLFTSLKTLVGTISAKDRYTLGHSQRVMDYAVMIGTELDLSNEDLKVLKIAALLHDIGKIEIPQSILNKKERLTQEEFNLIKLHPVYSAEILTPLSNLGKLHSIVLYHHERYDGKGYPDGIKGEKIPFESRILSIADSFDAMTSERPYKTSLSLNEAIQELKICSGTQFDKNIVDTFTKVLEKQKFNN